MNPTITTAVRQMTTIKTVKQVAEKFGAILTEIEFNEYDESYSVMVYAPDGKQWSDGKLNAFVCTWYNYHKEDKREKLNNLITRMNLGIEDLED